MSSSRWPSYVRRNARAIVMISSLVISSASSSAHQFLVSPQYFRFGLNSGVIRSRHRRWYVPPTKRRCCTTKPLLRASVGESDIYNADELEEEILEFMVNSEKSESFPSKKELVDAGGDDLVDAIVNQGGWFSLGWDLEEDDEEQQPEEISDEVSDNMRTTTTAVQNELLQTIIKSAWDGDDDDEEEEEEEEDERKGSAMVSFCPYDDPQSVSSPGGSL